jgi:hypothetical protein
MSSMDKIFRKYARKFPRINRSKDNGEIRSTKIPRIPSGRRPSRNSIRRSQKLGIRASNGASILLGQSSPSSVFEISTSRFGDFSLVYLRDWNLHPFFKYVFFYSTLKVSFVPIGGFLVLLNFLLPDGLTIIHRADLCFNYYSVEACSFRLVIFQWLPDNSLDSPILDSWLSSSSPVKILFDKHFQVLPSKRLYSSLYTLSFSSVPIYTSGTSASGLVYAYVISSTSCYSSLFLQLGLQRVPL